MEKGKGYVSNLKSIDVQPHPTFFVNLRHLSNDESGDEYGVEKQEKKSGGGQREKRQRETKETELSGRKRARDRHVAVFAPDEH